ncbi:MAG: biotin--[acetyl-CoA-carboxylase] ligase [Acidobacteria bacterium]|nr:biotin--[acetyl-CoA-carboxylase] ligase [Acidobacteriota bacterium]
MIVLCDCPERLAGLAGTEDGAETRVDRLPPTEQALWRVLGGTGRPWRGVSPGPGPPGFWSHAVVVSEAPSSQFDVLRESLAGALQLPGPTACVALSGRGFHGQRGRPWLSAPGNLHMCVAFPSPPLVAREALSLPMLPALAVVDAVRVVTGGALRPGIKWVNDLLVDGHKIGGVLTATQVRADRIDAILLGIGVNVATAPPVPPTPFVPLVGCLAEAGVKTTWAEVAFSVMTALGRRMGDLAVHGPGALLDAYRASSLVIGQEVCVFSDSQPGETRVGATPPLRGTVRDIAADLSLVLEGVETPVTSGRLAFAEDCRDSAPGPEGPTEPT